VSRAVLRQELPNRRETECIPFRHGDMEFYGHVGHFPDGRPAEVFISAVKTGTQIDATVREASTILSLALQFGADFNKIRLALPRDPAGKPQTPLGSLMDILAESPQP
jgi:hypothetical protein